MNTETWPDFTTLPFERPKRNEGRVMVRVDIEPSATEICGSLLKRGENTLLVYKSDLEAIRKVTQTAEDLARLEVAKTLYEAGLATFARESKLTREEAEKTYPKSLYAFYYEAGGTSGLPPVKSFVVGPEVPAPESPESVAMNTASSNAMLTQVLTKLLERMERKDATKK